MHPIRLISEIYKHKWLIEPIYALQQGPIVAALLNGNIMAGENQADDYNPKLKCFAVDAKTPSTRFRYSLGWDNAPYGSVAIIPVTGSLMKEDQDCGPSGMATIGRIIKQADEQPNIKAILLRIDSPGGTVDGTETLANIIKAVEKPIITFVDGMMASAALWIGSSADEVWASTDIDEVGSVGVLLNFGDLQPYWEKQGVVFHTIKASTSPDKVKMWEDIRAGKYDAYIKEVLDPIDEKFMNTMRANRPGVEDRHLTGKVFFARDVMGVYVDAIGTIEQAIEHAAQLADENEATNNNNNNTKSMKQFTHLNTVLGIESLESVDEVVSLNEEQLEAVDTMLATAETVTSERNNAMEQVTALTTERDNALEQVTTLTSERDNAVAAQTTAEEQVNSLTAERDAATAALAEFDTIDATIAAAVSPAEKVAAIRTLLASKPGFAPIATLDDEDPDSNATVDADWDAIDNLPHNKEVDNNL